jgi:acetyltransferase-like isoleucine patch superfamily enzyme
VIRFYRWAALSDHWAPTVLRRIRSALLNFGLPIPHPFAKLMLAVYLGCRTLFKFFVRVLFCEPGFKAYCSSYGKGLRTTTHLPWVQGKGRIVVGDDVRIHGRIAIAFAVRYSEAPTLEIGDRSSIGHDSNFVIGKRVVIGKDCLIANEVIIFDAPGHPTNASLRRERAAAPPEAVKPVTLCDNVWIGQRGIIYPGVTIGEGAVVSAGSVVMSDVASHTIVAGNPARRISYADLSKSLTSAKPAFTTTGESNGTVSPEREER